jgi:broad specificity phosphatase PhoE
VESRTPQPACTVSAPCSVHLLRHGLVDNPRRLVYGRLPGWHLSAEGRRQAEAAARRLRGRPIAAVYSSPLERARETADVVAAEQGLPVAVRDDLTESALAARWEGLAWSEVKTARRDEWEAYLRQPLQMTDVPETLTALAARMERAIREIAAAHPGQEVVAVSHGDPIRAGVLALTGGGLERLQQVYLPTGAMITMRVSPAAAMVAERWSGD